MTKPAWKQFKEDFESSMLARALDAADDCRTCGVKHSHSDWHSLGVLCARCEQHTGNNHQGHYWKLCSKTRTVLDEFHFCCPTLDCPT